MKKDENKEMTLNKNIITYLKSESKFEKLL